MTSSAALSKIHYKGQNEDFIVLVKSQQDYEKWLQDKSIGLAEVVDGYQIFVTNKHGNQGKLLTASNAVMDNEFDTHKDDEVITKILERGDYVSTMEKGQGGETNASRGAKHAHGHHANVS